MTDAWKNAFVSKPRSEWLTTEQIDALPREEPTGGTCETCRRYCTK